MTDKYVSCSGHQFVRQLNFERIISSKLNPLKVSNFIDHIKSSYF